MNKNLTGTKYGCRSRDEARALAKGRKGARVEKVTTYGFPWRVVF